LKVDEFREKGHLDILDQLQSDPNIRARLSLMDVLGIGPKMAQCLVEKDHIMSVKDLAKAYKDGRIKLTRMQILGLKYFDKLNERIPRKEVTTYIQKITKVLKKHLKEIKIIPAGSYRRGKPTSGDIDIILTVPEIKNQSDFNKYPDMFDQIIAYLIKEKMMLEVVNQSGNAMMGITPTFRHVDIKLSPTNLVPFFLLYFGSGVDFARNIRQRAKEKGYKLTEWGLQNAKSGRYIMNRASSEEEIFKKLDEPYIKPIDR